MRECAELSALQLLALVAANFAPLKKCSDGRWRSVWQQFPAAGIADDEIRCLSDIGLIEIAPASALVTCEGRTAMLATGAVGDFPAIPALPGQMRAPSLVQ